MPGAGSSRLRKNRTNLHCKVVRAAGKIARSCWLGYRVVRAAGKRRRGRISPFSFCICPSKRTYGPEPTTNKCRLDSRRRGSRGLRRTDGSSRVFEVFPFAGKVLSEPRHSSTTLTSEMTTFGVAVIDSEAAVRISFWYIGESIKNSEPEPEAPRAKEREYDSS